MVAMVLAPVSPVYHVMFSIPNIAFESSMACRVFRNVKVPTTEEFTLWTSSRRSNQTPESALGAFHAQTINIQMTQTEASAYSVKQSKSLVNEGQPNQGLEDQEV
jgi:hypothetical protein